MTARVFEDDRARALERRRIIDDVMGNKDPSERREFACHVDVVFAIHGLILAPQQETQAGQAQICADIGVALTKLHSAARPATADGIEMIREQLYLAARRNGTRHADAVSTTAQQVGLLRSMVGSAVPIAKAAKAASRAIAKQKMLEDSLIQDLAHYYDQDFAVQPSTSKNGKFSKLLRRLLNIRAHDDRLGRLFATMAFTGAEPKPGDKMRFREK